MKQILWDLDYRKAEVLSLCDRLLWPNGRTEDELHDDLAEDHELRYTESLSISASLEALVTEGTLEKLPNSRYRSVEVL